MIMYSFMFLSAYIENMLQWQTLGVQELCSFPYWKQRRSVLI